MIVYPMNWRKVGVTITAADIEFKLLGVLHKMNCSCLAFSGGLDSTLLLYYMCQVFDSVWVFTIGDSKTHPDIVFAKKVVKYYRETSDTSIEHKIYCPTKRTIERERILKDNKEEDLPGDEAVRLFYKFASLYTEDIVAGDGVDEFMGGYYAHQNEPCEKTYYEYMERLQTQQLMPLSKNSGTMRVYLPYIDEGIIFLLSQIPLAEKVDLIGRKKIMVEMAKGKVPDEVITRRKYGFCDALTEKT